MRRGKRCTDFLLSLVGLLALAPVLAAVALVIRVLDGRPVLFRQERVGHEGRVFRIYKFRTMRTAEGGRLVTVSGDGRITKLGRWLRWTKVDELPQLWNVLVGEMSLVGPRPEVPHYVALYSAEQRKVLQLTPGITDVASIRYRKEAELLGAAEDAEATYVCEILPDKIRLNLEYARRATLWTDVRVVLATLFLCRGVPGYGRDVQR